MEKTAAFLKALAHPIRLRLAALLAVNGTVCVCRLAEALGEPQFKVSRHLGIMRSYGIVEARRQGPWIHYSLAHTNHPLEKTILQALPLLQDDPDFQTDLERLGRPVCAR